VFQSVLKKIEAEQTETPDSRMCDRRGLSSGSYMILQCLLYIHKKYNTVVYARTNVIGSRTSFVIASVRSRIHGSICI